MKRYTVRSIKSKPAFPGGPVACGLEFVESQRGRWVKAEEAEAVNDDLKFFIKANNEHHHSFNCAKNTAIRLRKALVRIVEASESIENDDGTIPKPLYDELLQSIERAKLVL